MECVLQHDSTAIEGIWYAATDIGDAGHKVGLQGVERIKVISVAGEYGYVPWFEVVKSDGSASRVNGRYVVEVIYMKEKNDETTTGLPAAADAGGGGNV